MAGRASQRTAIAQMGRASSGKSSTIRMFHEQLLRRFPDAAESHRKGKEGAKDYRVIVTIGRSKVGIETLGDPSNTRQDESLDLFVNQDCVAIVTACRTRGETFDRVEGLGARGYEVIWRDRDEVGEGDHETANRREAKWMLGAVAPLL